MYTYIYIYMWMSGVRDYLIFRLLPPRFYLQTSFFVGDYGFGNMARKDISGSLCAAEECCHILFT